MLVGRLAVEWDTGMGTLDTRSNELGFGILWDWIEDKDGQGFEMMNKTL